MTVLTSSVALVATLTLAVTVSALDRGSLRLPEEPRSAADLLAQSSGQSGTGGSTEQPHTHGPGTKPHSHAATKDEILKKARAERDRLIREQKLDPSWKTVDEPTTLEQKPFKGRNEWVVTFQHPVPPDKSKERLYLFFTSGGRFLAANHTGR